jgi:hypothetical protein
VKVDQLVSQVASSTGVDEDTVYTVMLHLGAAGDLPAHGDLTIAATVLGAAAQKSGVTRTKPSGVKTLRTLRAAMDLPRFTVASLAEYAGVSKRTVNTVLKRYEQMFEGLGPVEKVGSKRGRPPERYSLRPERIEEVAALVQSIQTSLPASARAEALGVSADVSDALLVSAADALARTADADADDVPYLLDAVHSSVSTVRSAQKADIATEARMDFLESVEQVVRTTLSKDQVGLDAAQAQALTHAVAASAYMPAHEWLPLAGIALRTPSSVMLGPVMVDEALQPEIQSLFPTLILDPNREKLREHYVRLLDKRLPKLPTQLAGVYLAFVDDDAPSIPHENVVFVGKRPESFASVITRHGLFVLKADAPSTRTEIAKAVNRYALGFK